MGGWINTCICAIAALLFFGKGHPVLFWSAVIVGIVAFWSHGIMRNYQQLGSGDLKEIPNWLASLNMLATFVGVGLLIAAIIFRIR